MTSAILSDNKKRSNSFMSVFLWSIKKHKALLIVYSALLLFSSPIIGLIAGTSLSSFNNPVTPATFGFLTTGVAMIMTVIVPAVLLDYLHNKRKADMFCALPIKRRSLFFSRWLSGLAILIIPYIINSVIACILSLPCGPPNYPGFNAVAFTVNTVVISLLSIIASYSFTSFIALCCGTTMNTVLCTIFINISYPLAYSSMSSMFASIIPGINIKIAGNLLFNDILSPLLSPFNDILVSAYGGLHTAYIPFFNVSPESLISSIIIIAASITACAVIAKNRKSEAAQSSFAYKTPGIIIRFIATAAAGMIAAMILSSIPMFQYTFFSPEKSAGISSPDPWFIYLIFIITFAITAFIAHLVVTAIFNKGFKGFLKSLICYGLVVLIIGGTYTTLAFGGFGADKYIPDLDEIAEVQVDYSEFEEYGLAGTLTSALFNIFSVASYFNYDDQSSSRPQCIQALAEEDIKSVLDIHREIIENFPQTDPMPYHIRNDFEKYAYKTNDYEPEDYESEDYEPENSIMQASNIRFIYKLKNGSTIAREYNSQFLYNTSLGKELLKLKERTLTHNAEILKGLIGDENYEFTSIELNGSEVYYYSYDCIKNKSAVNAFIAAFIRDFESGGEQKYNNCICANLQFNYRDKRSGEEKKLNAFIPSSFKNTKAALSSYGYYETIQAPFYYSNYTATPTESEFTLPESISGKYLKDSVEVMNRSENISLSSVNEYIENVLYGSGANINSPERLLVEAYQRDELYCRIVYSDSEGKLYYYDDKFSDFEKYKNRENDIKETASRTRYDEDISSLYSFCAPYLRDKSDSSKIYSPAIIQFYTDDENVLTSPMNIEGIEDAPSEFTFTGIKYGPCSIVARNLISADGKSYIYLSL